MNDDVFKAFRRFLGEIGVETNAACNRVAATPFGLHPPHKKPLHLHADVRLPFRDQWRHGLPELLTIPFLYDGLPLVFIGARTNMEPHPAVRQFNGRRMIAFNDLQQVTPPPDIMAFAVEILPWSFTVLFAQLRCWRLDPTQFGNGKHADGVEIHSEWRGDPHPGRSEGRRSGGCS